MRGLLSRRGRWPEAEAGSDPFAVQEPWFASAVAASLQGRIALGLRAGQPVRRLRSAAPATATGRRSARLEGFSLHADVAVPARRRDQLEKLCRYIVRPPLALERLTESPGGQLLYQLRRAWSDGSTALLLEPLELLERLAALVPPPRRPLLAYHGLLAPRSRWRAGIVPKAASDAAGADTEAGVPRRWPWARCSSGCSGLRCSCVTAAGAGGGSNRRFRARQLVGLTTHWLGCELGAETRPRHPTSLARHTS